MAELGRRQIPVLLMGMLTPPNMGRDYARQFDPIFPALARKHHAGLVPFFLTAVIDHPELRQADRMHPTAPGVEAIVKATQEAVVQALASKPATD
jgi:acyl-CoA thioesterase-1